MLATGGLSWGICNCGRLVRLDITDDISTGVSGQPKSARAEDKAERRRTFTASAHGGIRQPH